MEHPVGREALARLVRRADVVVQNLAPGAAAGLGLDPAELRAARPELITVDISGFGKGGPYAQGRAYDLLIQALGEHTELVLRKLGFSTEDLAVMRAEGAEREELNKEYHSRWRESIYRHALGQP